VEEKAIPFPPLFCVLFGSKTLPQKVGGATPTGPEKWQLVDVAGTGRGKRGKRQAGVKNCNWT